MASRERLTSIVCGLLFGSIATANLFCMSGASRWQTILLEFGISVILIAQGAIWPRRFDRLHFALILVFLGALLVANFVLGPTEGLHFWFLTTICLALMALCLVRVIRAK